MSAATNGGWEVMFASELDGGDHVSDAGATYDQRRVLVDHGVVNLTCLVVARFTWKDKLSA
jgi:hypothetical protein